MMLPVSGSSGKVLLKNSNKIFAFLHWKCKSDTPSPIVHDVMPNINYRFSRSDPLAINVAILVIFSKFKKYIEQQSWTSGGSHWKNLLKRSCETKPLKFLCQSNLEEDMLLFSVLMFPHLFVWFLEILMVCFLAIVT